ncbi:MAG: sugar ABC transporter permease [Anaerolineae bacterium]|nr:sugar ABC transporter permease [Anaerolineae bacterium]
MVIRSNFQGYLFASPWLFGFFVFTLGPFIASLVISLHQWDILTPMQYVGLRNFERMLQDNLFWHSLRVTVVYTIFAVPLQLAMAMLLAVLVNGNGAVKLFFRAVFFLPSVTAGVAVAVLWRWLFNPEFGLINFLLDAIGIQGPPWLSSPAWALPAVIVMSLWGVGSTMLIFLASLQAIPDYLYEAAEIDGANMLHKFRFVTLPMMSSTIFFTLVMGIIGSFQIFTQIYILTNGGPENATLFYVLYLYQQAFRSFKMGFASALAWVLFLIVMVVTLIQFRLAGRWVYYELGE